MVTLDFTGAIRLQFGPKDTQNSLKQLIERRTQGSNENISTYLMKLKGMLDQVKPPFPIQDQLDRAYRNLHPLYRKGIERTDFDNFTELQRLGKREEARRQMDETYKPPPTMLHGWARYSYVDPTQDKPRKLAAVATLPKPNPQAAKPSLVQAAPIVNPNSPRSPQQPRQNNFRYNKQQSPRKQYSVSVKDNSENQQQAPAHQLKNAKSNRPRQTALQAPQNARSQTPRWAPLWYETFKC